MVPGPEVDQTVGAALHRGRHFAPWTSGLLTAPAPQRDLLCYAGTRCAHLALVKYSDLMSRDFLPSWT